MQTSQSDRSVVNKRHLLQSPSDSEVRHSTIEKNDLFEEEDECLGLLLQSAEKFSHKGTTSHLFIHKCVKSLYIRFFYRDPPSDRQLGVPASHTGTATTTIIISVVPARRTAGSHCTSWEDSSQQSRSGWELSASTAVCVGGADTQEVLHMENHHQDTEGAGCCTPG